MNLINIQSNYIPNYENLLFKSQDKEYQSNKHIFQSKKGTQSLIQPVLKQQYSDGSAINKESCHFNFKQDFISESQKLYEQEKQKQSQFNSIRKPIPLNKSAFTNIKSSKDSASSPNSSKEINYSDQSSLLRSPEQSSSPSSQSLSQKIQEKSSLNSKQDTQESMKEQVQREEAQIKLDQKRKWSFNTALQAIINQTFILSNLKQIQKVEAVQNKNSQQNKIITKEVAHEQLQKSYQEFCLKYKNFKQQETYIEASCFNSIKNEIISQYSQYQIDDIEKQFNAKFQPKDIQRIFPQMRNDQNYYLEIQKLKEQVSSVTQEIDKVQKEKDLIMNKISHIELFRNQYQQEGFSSAESSPQPISSQQQQLILSPNTSSHLQSLMGNNSQFGKNQLKEYSSENQLSETLNKKTKRHRRTALEIERHYLCPSGNCGKQYGSEGSLNQHIKLKHPNLVKSRKELNHGGMNLSKDRSDDLSLEKSHSQSDSQDDEVEDEKEILQEN